MPNSYLIYDLVVFYKIDVGQNQRLLEVILLRLLATI